MFFFSFFFSFLFPPSLFRVSLVTTVVCFEQSDYNFRAFLTVHNPAEIKDAPDNVVTMATNLKCFSRRLSEAVHLSPLLSEITLHDPLTFKEQCDIPARRHYLQILITSVCDCELVELEAFRIVCAQTGSFL